MILQDFRTNVVGFAMINISPNNFLITLLPPNVIKIDRRILVAVSINGLVLVNMI